ncbi:hypothetical protein A2U01_0102398, partial [Trifolium medium]|nr:hypothetical protein [Trifolium medium]
MSVAVASGGRSGSQPLKHLRGSEASQPLRK